MKTQRLVCIALLPVLATLCWIGCARSSAPSHSSAGESKQPGAVPKTQPNLGKPSVPANETQPQAEEISHELSDEVKDQIKAASAQERWSRERMHSTQGSGGGRAPANVGVAPKPAKPEMGAMDFNPPPVMTLNVPAAVDVAVRRFDNGTFELVPGSQEEAIDLGLTGSGPMQGVKVPVASVMEVELRSEEPGAFDIKLAGETRKSLDAGGHAEWHWTVTPQQSGEKHLLLHSMRIFDGSPTDDGTRPATITVVVLPWYQRIGPDTGKLLADNWKSILSFLLPSGSLVGILTWWQARKKKKEPDAGGGH